MGSIDMRRIAAAAFAVVALGYYAWAQLAPVPALPDSERRTEYNITAQTGPFSLNFALYGDSTDYANWVQVFVNGVQTTAWTLSSPSGAIGSIPLPITDAQITFNAAQTGKVEIVGARRPRRLSQFTENRPVSAHDLNVLVTDLVAQLREHWDRAGRILQVPPGETLAMLPPAASRANQNATFDSLGNLTPSLPVSGGAVVSSAMQPVVAAATTAQAAALLGFTSVPVGTVVEYAGFTAPAKYDFAAGQSYSRVSYPDLLTALTSSQTGTCSSGSPTITGLADTSQFANGQRIEGSRIPSLTNTVTAVVSASSITVQSAATSSGSCTIQVFPWGNGDGLTTFTLPDKRGFISAGRDNMVGVSPRNILQVTTTMTTTGGSPTATVASATGVAAGMTVVNPNVTPGTTISSISGTTVTLSANATNNGIGVVTRISMVGDAQGLGSSGGNTNGARASSLLEMPTHQHAVFLKDPGHTHSTNAQTVIGGTLSAAGACCSLAGATINAAVTGLTIGSVPGVANDNLTTTSGNGAAMATMQPTVATNYLIRILP